MLNGVVHQTVHLILIVGQAHHTKAQQRDLLARAVLHTVGHTILHHLFLVIGKSLERFHSHQRHSRAGTDAHTPQELTATHVFLFLHHLVLVLNYWQQRYEKKTN